MARSMIRATKDDLRDLDPEVRDLVAPHVLSATTLDKLSTVLCKRRDEARDARQSENIESIWKASEEAYIGIDDANRSEWAASKWSKPMSIEGPVDAGTGRRNTGKKSTVYVRLTARYVDAGKAKLCEILLPVDDKAFTIKELPDPDLTRAKENESHVVHDGLGGVPLTRPALPHEAAKMGQVLPFPGGQQAPQPTMGDIVAGKPQPGAPQVPLQVKDLAEEKINLAHKSAKAAEKRIHDWLVKSHYPAEVRKVIFDSAKLGVGVLKGPFPQTKRSVVVTKGDGGRKNVQVVNKILPAVKWINPRDFFPDPTCGEDIHSGEYTFERDHMTQKELQKLKRDPGYISSQIDKCIARGPSKKGRDSNSSDPAESEGNKLQNRFEVWYYHGALSFEDMQSINDAYTDQKGNAPGGSKDQTYVVATMIDDTLVKATINPLDSGSFPYHTVPWQRRAGCWAGIGIPEQLQTPQRMINGATRAMMDNAGVAAGPQTVIDISMVYPADGSWEVTPNKVWYLKKGSNVSPGGVKEAFGIFELPNTTDPLMKIVEYSLKLAEESTSIPLITQGQTSETTPETYGASQLQDTNANQLLRDIGYSFDDNLTEPLINMLYEWLLLDPDVPDDEKEQFDIEAHGSSSLVERAIQDQTIAQMGEMVLNPAYGGDPKRWFKIMLKSKRIHPADLTYSDQELQRMESAPQPSAPQVEVANINAASKREEIAAKQSGDQRTTQNEAQIAQAANEMDSRRLESEDRRTLTDATVKLHQVHADREKTQLENAAQRDATLADVMVELRKLQAAVGMNEADKRHDREMVAHDHVREIHGQHHDRQHEAEQADLQRAHDMKKHVMTIEAKPPVQTPGRAADGRAFEQG